MDRAAVLLAIFANPPHEVIFVERAGHLRRNPSQIGLPGGIAEPIDGANLAATALRELSEEVGIRSEFVRIVGRLADEEQTSHGLLVTPIVGVLAPRTAVVPDAAEIAGYFTVPLQTIVARGALREEAGLRAGRSRPAYVLDYTGHRIWGFTAKILKSFATAWNAPGSVLRRDVEVHW